MVQEEPVCIVIANDGPAAAEAPADVSRHAIRRAVAAAWRRCAGAIAGGPASRARAGGVRDRKGRSSGRFPAPTAVRAIVVAVALSFPGAPALAHDREPPMTTGRILSAAQLQSEVHGAFVGDSLYAEVNSRWLTAFYADFRREIFRQGVVRWDNRFDCSHFADYYRALAQTRFYRAYYQSWTPAQTLAIGTFWYNPLAGGPAHAIVMAVTERGLIFIEPQTGHEVHPQPLELSTARLKMF